MWKHVITVLWIGSLWLYLGYTTPINKYIIYIYIYYIYIYIYIYIIYIYQNIYFNIYIYAFSRHFYPKRLTLHQVSFFFTFLSALAFPGKIYFLKKLLSRAAKRLIVINRFKKVCLHTICVCTVYIYVYINTHVYILKIFVCKLVYYLYYI